MQRPIDREWEHGDLIWRSWNTGNEEASRRKDERTRLGENVEHVESYAGGSIEIKRSRVGVDRGPFPSAGLAEKVFGAESWIIILLLADGTIAVTSVSRFAASMRNWWMGESRTRAIAGSAGSRGSRFLETPGNEDRAIWSVEEWIWVRGVANVGDILQNSCCKGWYKSSLEIWQRWKEIFVKRNFYRRKIVVKENSYEEKFPMKGIWCANSYRRRSQSREIPMKGINESNFYFKFCHFLSLANSKLFSPVRAYIFHGFPRHFSF